MTNLTVRVKTFVRAQPRSLAGALPSTNEETTMKPLSISIDACCSVVGVRRTTIYKLIKEGKLVTIKIGRRTLITMQSVDALVAPAASIGDAR